MSPAMRSVDLNSDVGESYGRWRLGDDEAVLRVVTSANVACGFHAGDPDVLRRVCRQAAERGVAVGAQVGYRDLAGFGRRAIDVDPATLTGRIEPSANEVVLTTRGLRDVSVWLGRNPAGQYMVDFEKPLTVRVGLTAYVVNRKIRPDLAVLLEDLYSRGDRRQLYVAKVQVAIR